MKRDFQNYCRSSIAFLLTGCKKEVSYREFQQEVNKAEEKRYEKAIVEGKAYKRRVWARNEHEN